MDVFDCLIKDPSFNVLSCILVLDNIASNILDFTHQYILELLLEDWFVAHRGAGRQDTHVKQFAPSVESKHNGSTSLVFDLELGFSAILRPDFVSHHLPVSGRLARLVLFALATLHLLPLADDIDLWFHALWVAPEAPSGDRVCIGFI